MIIIWQRWGILVVLFALVGVLLGVLLGLLSGNSKGPGIWVLIGAGVAAAGVGLHFFTRRVVDVHLDKPRPLVVTQDLEQAYIDEYGRSRTQRTEAVVDPETGEPVLAKPTSSLFFVPMKYWSYVLAVLGVVVALIAIVFMAF